MICTIIVHAINNTLSLTLAWCSANHAELPNTLDWAIKANGAEWSYQPEWITMSVLLTLALLVVLFRRDSSTQQVVQAEMV